MLPTGPHIAPRVQTRVASK